MRACWQVLVALWFCDGETLGCVSFCQMRMCVACVWGKLDSGPVNGSFRARVNRAGRRLPRCGQTWHTLGGWNTGGQPAAAKSNLTGT
jgi:hypothetical protein